MHRFLSVTVTVVTVAMMLLCSTPPGAAAADYPDHALTIIVPFSAGGPTDTLARMLGQYMSHTLGQRVLVVNVGGSGGAIGTLRGKRAEPDGYTVIIGNMGTHGAAVALYDRLGYNPSTDFEPLGLLATAPIVIVGRRDLQPPNLQEFITYLQVSGHSLDEGNAGAGSVSFTAGLMLAHLVGANPRIVPYDGAGRTMEALSQGEVDYTCDQVINVVAAVRAGKVKAYAVASPERSQALLGVPTTREAGLPEYQLSAWTAMFAPKGVSMTVVEKLNGVILDALNDETFRKRLLDLGVDIPTPEQRTPQFLAAFVKTEIDHWSEIIRAAGKLHVY